MAEPVNGGNNPVQPPKEMSMEMRLLLAFLLMGAVMFVFQYLSPQAPAPPQKKQAAASQPADQTKAPAAAESAPAPPVQPQAAKAKPAAANPAATPQVVLPPLEISTDLYRVVLSNQGATIRSWQLTKWKGNDNKPLELVNLASGLDFPLSLYFPGAKPEANINWTWFKQTVDPDGLGVTYEYSDGHLNVR